MAYPHDPWTHTPQPTTRSRGGGRSGGRGTRSAAAACAWLAALAVVVALTVGHTSLPTVDAAFSTRTSSQATVSTATLAAPTGLTTSRTCPSASTPPVRKQFSASNSGAGAAQVTTVTPADAAAGDVLIAYVTVANSSGNAAATGWSIAAQTNGDGMSMTALYLRLESAPAPSYTFTWQDGTAGTVFLVAYGGADPFSPIATMNATWGTGIDDGSGRLGRHADLDVAVRPRRRVHDQPQRRRDRDGPGLRDHLGRQRQHRDDGLHVLGTSRGGRLDVGGGGRVAGPLPLTSASVAGHPNRNTVGG